MTWEMAPRHNPSSMAYAGAATGEVVGLKVPTRQAISPPINPTSNKGPRSSGCVQANAPEAKQSRSRMPVLFTTPCRVIDSPCAQALENAPSRFNNGLDVSMREQY